MTKWRKGVHKLFGLLGYRKNQPSSNAILNICKLIKHTILIHTYIHTHIYLYYYTDYIDYVIIIHYYKILWLNLKQGDVDDDEYEHKIIMINPYNISS